MHAGDRVGQRGVNGDGQTVIGDAGDHPTAGDARDRQQLTGQEAKVTPADRAFAGDGGAGVAEGAAGADGGSRVEGALHVEGVIAFAEQDVQDLDRGGSCR